MLYKEFGPALYSKETQLQYKVSRIDKENDTILLPKKYTVTSQSKIQSKKEEHANPFTLIYIFII